MKRRYSRQRRRSTGAWMYLVLLGLMAIGATVSYDQTHGPAETAQRERCEATEWATGMDTEAWAMLQEQGYTDRPDDGRSALYPPGCEGVTS